MKQFLDRLTDNWIPKAMCFVVALGIYCIYNATTVDSATFIIPLQIVENGSLTAATSVARPRSVRVTVRTRSEQLPAITESDFAAFVDITAHAEEGEYSFPVQVQASDRLMLLDPLEVSVNIGSVFLRVEEKRFRFVPVSPSLSGSPAYGYTTSQVTVTPSSVKVSGPRSAVEGLDAVYTDRVDIEGITHSVTQNVQLVNDSQLLEMDASSPVVVRVNLEAAGLTKDFSGISVRCVNLADGLLLRNGPFQLSVTVEGDVLELEGVDSSQISAEADCAFITDAGTYSVPVSVNLPGSLLLNYQSISSVGVSVERVPEPEPEEPVPADAGGVADGAGGGEE